MKRLTEPIFQIETTNVLPELEAWPFGSDLHP
jgi:hypothetical protein